MRGWEIVLIKEASAQHGGEQEGVAVSTGKQRNTKKHKDPAWRTMLGGGRGREQNCIFSESVFSKDLQHIL